MFLKGSDEPLHVRTIREDERNLVVGIPQADGTFQQRVFARVEVDEVIRTVKPERLEALSPDNATAYRDYAEELAEKRVDPDARDAAVRLYVIAAYLDPEKLGRSSLLGLTALARTPAEERKYRAMVYLLDPKHDRSVLKRPAEAGAAGVAGESREKLLSMIRYLRRGNRRIAERMAERSDAEALFARYGGEVSHEEFLDVCRSSEGLSPGTLAKLLRLEIRLSGGPPIADGDTSSAADKRPSWSAAIAAGNTDPVPSLTLETLTEFDPRNCVYRDGKWVAPSDQ